LVLTDSTGAVSGLAIAPDSRTCGSVSGNGKVLVRDLLTRQGLFSLHLAGQGLTRVVFHPAGRQIACVSDDRSIHLWQADGKSLDFHLHDPTGLINAIAYRPDGNELASAGHDEQVMLWDPQTGKRLHSWRAHQDVIRSLAYHPDRPLLASAGEDRRVR